MLYHRHSFRSPIPVHALLLKEIRALRSAHLTFLLLAAITLSAQAQSATNPSHDVLIKNATVMTVTHGNIQNGSIYIKDGKIAAVGASVNAPADATFIDAGGKYLTKKAGAVGSGFMVWGWLLFYLRANDTFS